MVLPEVIFLWWLKVACFYHQVNPSLAWAVAHVESRLPGQSPLRYGRLGRSPYYGPMGLNKHCFPRDRIQYEDPFLNVWNGVKALRASRRHDLTTTLRKYNPQATAAYLAAVRQAMDAYR